MPQPPLERIQRRLAAVPHPDPDACHEWPGARQKSGHGKVDPGPAGGSWQVARHVLEAALGRSLRPGMYALHTCDNPPCCNPRHLYEGTPLRNQQDAAERGRRAVGQRMTGAVLSPDSVRAIREDARSHGTIAAEYGVARSLVTMIKLRQRWAHLP